MTKRCGPDPLYDGPRWNRESYSGTARVPPGGHDLALRGLIILLSLIRITPCSLKTFLDKVLEPLPHLMDSGHFQLYTAETRLDLWEGLSDLKHPLNKVWPSFLLHELTAQSFSRKINQFEGLRKFQFTIVERGPAGEELVVARARSVPFFWPEFEEIRDSGGISAHPHVLNSLPDGGWGTIVSRGIRQHILREGLPPSSVPPPLTKDQEKDWIACQAAAKPNALSALSMTVRADRRQRGLAEMLVEAMKQTARAEGLQSLVVPLRPTRKAEFPLVPMHDYMTWKHQKEVPSTFINTSSPPTSTGHLATCDLPFDPWLRKHISLGGTMVKVAPCSMVVHGSITDWQEWTGVNFNHELQEIQSKNVKKELESNRDYLEIPFPGGLAPLRLYVTEKCCSYFEPNIWVYHDISRIG